MSVGIGVEHWWGVARVSGGGHVTGGALLLCFHVVFVVTMDLCASHIMLSTLKIRSFNVCGMINNMVALFDFIGNTVSSSARHCVAFRLKGKGASRLRGIFRADVGIRLLMTLLVLFLNRATKL